MSIRFCAREGQVQLLHVDLEELTGALKRFLNVEGSGQPVPESQRSMQDYVFEYYTSFGVGVRQSEETSRM
jgi:hypothetical protein